MQIGAPLFQPRWYRLKVGSGSLKAKGISMKPTATESTHPSIEKNKIDKGKSCVDDSKSKDQRQAEEESGADTVSKPGGFDNDPDDPTNPNEVRERHLKKIKQ
jgi:hypothetical protein